MAVTSLLEHYGNVAVAVHGYVIVVAHRTPCETYFEKKHEPQERTVKETGEVPGLPVSTTSFEPHFGHAKVVSPSKWSEGTSGQPPMPVAVGSGSGSKLHVP